MNLEKLTQVVIVLVPIVAIGLALYLTSPSCKKSETNVPNAIPEIQRPKKEHNKPKKNYGIGLANLNYDLEYSKRFKNHNYC